MSGVDWEPLDCQGVAGSHRARNRRGKSHPPSQLPEMCTLSFQTACFSSQLRQNAIFLSAVCTGANPNEYYSHTSVQTLCRLQRLIKPHVATYSSCTQMLGEALPAMTSPPCPCPSMHPPHSHQRTRIPQERRVWWLLGREERMSGSQAWTYLNSELGKQSAEGTLCTKGSGEQGTQGWEEQGI